VIVMMAVVQVLALAVLAAAVGLGTAVLIAGDEEP
jgi:hypothetical protein